jgi:malic enzyme
MVHRARADLDETKRSLAVSPEAALAHGLDPTAVSTLADVVERVRPTILVGTTGVAGTFTEPVVRTLARSCSRPIILPLSNPTSNTEARPTDLLRWTDGRAIIATGSPFAPVIHEGRRHEIGQANNVYVFPGIGLGAIVSGARSVSDRMILAAARTLAEAVTHDRLAGGALYPPVGALRAVSRSVAIAVGHEAIASGLSAASADTLEAEVDAAMWWPRYVPYLRPSDSG